VTQLQIFDVLHSLPDETQKLTPKSMLKSDARIATASRSKQQLTINQFN